MTLRQLLEGVETAVEDGMETEVSGVAYDSRRVRRGDVFFALEGGKSDGRDFARQAVEAGAVAVVARALELPGIPVVRVPEPRLALAVAAARWHGEPSLALRVVAITGTNGKTTTTYLLESVFAASGWTPGVIGTTGARLGGESRPLAFTTPEALELEALLRDMRERGVAAVALEMSSHALVQRRGYGLHSDVAVFPNLRHDHLDFHGTLEAYLDAKLMLFDGRNGDHGLKPWTAVVNADDPVAPRALAAAARGGGAAWTFGAAPGSTFRIVDVEPRPAGVAFALEHEGTRTPIALPLLGRHNAWNAAAAFAAARALGLSTGAVARGLAAVKVVPGRLERVVAGQPFEVVVDYAHTPDALDRALATAREHTRGEVLVVFGCGGDRDRAKRPAMGRVAAARADRIWVTSDNPRSEDPAAIAAEVVAGLGSHAATVELDRRAAIAEALAAARPGDLVLIAGKGHETTQTIGDRVLPFDDREVAREQLATLGTRGA